MYRCSYCPRDFTNPIGLGTHIGKKHRDLLNAAFFNDSYTAAANFDGPGGVAGFAASGLSPLLSEDPDGGYDEEHGFVDDFLGEVGDDAVEDGEAQAPNNFAVGAPPAWTAARVLQGAALSDTFHRHATVSCLPMLQSIPGL